MKSTRSNPKYRNAPTGPIPVANRLAVLVCMLCIFVPAVAADNAVSSGDAAQSEAPKQRRGQIEEVIVTAQKREESVQDVPISISVFSDRFIVEQGITDIEGLLRFTPNMQVESGTFLGAPRCRGFSLDIRNQAFEPPCGVAIDGVPYTSATYFQAALFDIQRVEVLRGPQGTTFGKNTTAGLIHLITQDPTDEFSGHIDVQGGELDRRRYDVALGGPLLPGLLNFRIAGMSEDRDGYLKNTTAEIVPEAVERPLTQDRQGLRAKLAFPDLFGSELKLSYESVDLKALGLNSELIDVTPEMQSFLRSFDPKADFKKGNFRNSIDLPEEIDVTIDTAQADWNYELFGWGIDVVGARSVIERTLAADPDSTPAPIFTAGSQGDKNTTTSFEFRALSPNFEGLFGLKSLFGWSLGNSDVLAGVFAQKRELDDAATDVCVDDTLLALFLALASSEEGVEVPLPPLMSAPVIECVFIRFDQDAETIAAFAEFKWYITERWTLQYGARLSQEEKTGVWDVRTTDFSPAFNAAGVRDFTDEKFLEERQFLPKATLNYNPTEDVGIFLHWTRGFKGGGFNAFPTSNDDPELPLEFGPEVAEEWGLDVKTTLLDGRMRLNVSAFRLEVEDFQFLADFFDETTRIVSGIAAINVGQALSQGVEADLTYLVTDWLTLIGTIGYNDTEFVEFPNNVCPRGTADTDGDGDPACDVSGEPFPFAPKWNNTLTAQIHYPLNLIGLDSINFTLGATVEYFSSQNLSSSLDPLARQSSFYRWQGNAGFASPTQGWSFQVTAENLTNERSSVRQIPNVGGFSVDFPEQPRVIYGQFRWAF